MLGGCRLLSTDDLSVFAQLDVYYCHGYDEVYGMATYRRTWRFRSLVFEKHIWYYLSEFPVFYSSYSFSTDFVVCNYADTYVSRLLLPCFL
jgi:hypothetical protein